MGVGAILRGSTAYLLPSRKEADVVRSSRSREGDSARSSVPRHVRGSRQRPSHQRPGPWSHRDRPLVPLDAMAAGAPSVPDLRPARPLRGPCGSHPVRRPWRPRSGLRLGREAQAHDDRRREDPQGRQFVPGRSPEPHGRVPLFRRRDRFVGTGALGVGGPGDRGAARWAGQADLLHHRRRGGARGPGLRGDRPHCRPQADQRPADIQLQRLRAGGRGQSPAIGSEAGGQAQGGWFRGHQRRRTRPRPTPRRLRRVHRQPGG